MWFDTKLSVFLHRSKYHTPRHRIGYSLKWERDADSCADSPRRLTSSTTRRLTAPAKKSPARREPLTWWNAVRAASLQGGAVIRQNE